MPEKRLLFCNDARHYHLYCFEPPISLEDARLPVDEIAGTGVDTLVYGFGAGPATFHLTEVGEVFASHIEKFKDMPGVHRGTLPAWRAYENIRSLEKRGVDLLKLLADAAHEKGLRIYGSVRQTHQVSPKDVDNYFNWQFKIDHPEWCLRGRGKHAFDFKHPEVRAERFVLAEEAVTRYDLDGLEIDWCYWPIFFEDDEIERNADLLTEHMRNHRRMVDRVSERKGRSIEFGARVLPTLEGNRAAGMNVDNWLAEDLLDFVVPNYYIDEHLDADFPFEWLAALASSTRCSVFPAMQRQIGRPQVGEDEPVGEEIAVAEHYYAGAAAYWQKGADGIYIPWFNWPIRDPDRRILTEIRDPDIVADRPKHYVVRGMNDGAEACGYTAQLPLNLINGEEPPGQTVRIYVAEGPNSVDPKLRIRLRYTTIHDSISVSVNGRLIDWDSCQREPRNYTPTEGPISGKGISSMAYTWLNFPVPSDWLLEGANQVGVAVRSRPPNLAGQIVLDRVDLVSGA